MIRFIIIFTSLEVLVLCNLRFPLKLKMSNLVKSIETELFHSREIDVEVQPIYRKNTKFINTMRTKKSHLNYMF